MQRNECNCKRKSIITEHNIKEWNKENLAMDKSLIKKKLQRNINKISAINKWLALAVWHDAGNNT